MVILVSGAVAAAGETPTLTGFHATPGRHALCRNLHRVVRERVLFGHQGPLMLFLEDLPPM